MACPVEYWIWLQRTMGAGKRLDEIVTYFGDPLVMYKAGIREWLASGVINKNTADNLSTYSPSQSRGIVEQCKNNGWHIVPFDSEYYPKQLRNIDSFPIVLYVSGDIEVLKSKVCIGMVGTRNASDYGLSVARSLAEDLAKAGAVIVSGGALGIDRASHEGAMDVGGKTIAFLGSGLGSSYLQSNSDMRSEIEKSGALVSEFMPFEAPTRKTFPIRNRLISGMSLGTVVIEAGEKSGSLITARTSAEQGRDVFAVPGDVTSSNYFGTNKLIRDGAKAVFSYMDVLDEYIYDYGDVLKMDDKYIPINKYVPVKIISGVADNTNEKKHTAVQAEKAETAMKEKKKIILPEYVSDTAAKIMEYITAEPQTADEIVEKSGFGIDNVLVAMTELEFYGAVTAHSGKRYSLKQ